MKPILIWPCKNSDTTEVTKEFLENLISTAYNEGKKDGGNNQVVDHPSCPTFPQVWYQDKTGVEYEKAPYWMNPSFRYSITC